MTCCVYPDVVQLQTNFVHQIYAHVAGGEQQHAQRWWLQFWLMMF